MAWRKLEPRRGKYDWAAMDRAVALARQTGAREVLWVHGSTPRWAAKDPDAPGLYGPGTSSPPKTKAYLETLRRVAKRYKGRITAYQVWNEANISIFYTGTAKELATLTRKARAVLAEVDPAAILVGASTTVRDKGPVKPFYERYLAHLAGFGWPVDALAVHLYPRADEGVEKRADYIRFLRPWLAERGWTGPVWDTEINYGERRSFAAEFVIVPQRVAVRWVARTYIDSLALGIERVHWYAWNDHILGIDQIDEATSWILPAGRAYLTTQAWLDRTRWDGCDGELVAPTGDRGALTSCSLTSRSGTPSLILFTHRGSTRIRWPEGARRICRLDGSCERVSGTRLRVTREPVLLRLSR